MAHPLHLVTSDEPTGSGTPAEALITGYVARYPNPETSRKKRRTLRAMFAATGHSDPARVNEAELIEWVLATPVNNTAYDRLSTARCFFRWATREGHLQSDPCRYFSESDSPVRQVHRTYGKRHGAYPGRWLTRHEAYTVLLGAAAGESDHDLRDRIVIRLGLSGLRRNEIASLRMVNLHLDTTVTTLTWTAKRRSQVETVIPPGLLADLRDWTTRYASALARPLAPTDPLICRLTNGRYGPRHVVWGRAFADSRAVYDIVRRRAQAAALGHVATHDLRRTAAGILHSATDANGAHYFDLLDIQKVLHHADPTTTMRSYLDPNDTAVYERAASFLDG